jgi:hypothetical protein
VTSTQRYYIKANPSTNPENLSGTLAVSARGAKQINLSGIEISEKKDFPSPFVFISV